MKRLLYKILPACLLAIGLQGCDDETRYNPLPEAVPLTMTVNGQAFAMGEHLRVDIEVNKDAEGNEVTPNEDFDVYFTAKSGSEDVSDLFDPFSNIVTFPKGEKKIQVDFPVKKEGLKGHKNLNFVAFARGYKMAHSSAVIKVSDYYRITMSLENNMDNTVLDGSKFVLVAQIDKPRSIPIRVAITPKEDEKDFFTNLPTSLIIPAGASKVKSEEVTLSSNGMISKSKELTLNFESSSNDNPMTEKTMAITLMAIEDPDLYDPTKVYADPEQMFMSGTNKTDFEKWWTGTKKTIAKNDPHPTQSLANNGWKFWSAIEYHFITKSFGWNMIPNTYGHRRPWPYSASTTVATQKEQAIDNDQCSNVTEDGILRMWAQKGPMNTTGISPVQSRNYGVAAFQTAKGEGASTRFIRIKPGMRIEFRVRVRGVRIGFVPLISLKNIANSDYIQDKNRIDILKNVSGNIVTQSVYLSQQEGTKKTSMPTLGEWNIYWVEWNNNKIDLGINGTTTMTVEKADGFNFGYATDDGMALLMNFSPSQERSNGSMPEGWDMTLNSITDPETDVNTPLMEMDWIRFYVNDSYSEGKACWTTAVFY